MVDDNTEKPAMACDAHDGAVPVTFHAEISEGNGRLRNLYVFDYDAAWERVKPVLEHPQALEALSLAMESWCEATGMAWHPKKGPWHFSKCDCWRIKAMEEFDAAGRHEDLCSWIEEQGLPDYRGSTYAKPRWLPRRPSDEVVRQVLRADGAVLSTASYPLTGIGVGELTIGLPTGTQRSGSCSFPRMSWFTRHSDAHFGSLRNRPLQRRGHGYSLVQRSAT